MPTMAFKIVLHFSFIDFSFTANQKEVRRVTVLHRSIPELHDSEGLYNIFILL